MNRQYRHEYKYRIDAAQEAALLIRAQGILQRDPHVTQGGSYIVRSLYFDDPLDSCLYEVEDGTDPRSKFRICCYNNDTGYIRLEKKGKYRGMTYKESVPLSRTECRALLAGEYHYALSGNMRKDAFLTELMTGNLRPAVIVTYERIPFVCPGENVRITFDKKLTSSDAVQQFPDGDYRQRPVFENGCGILECKWDGVLPLHIKEAMDFGNLTWNAFSKYYACRTYHL